MPGSVLFVCLFVCLFVRLFAAYSSALCACDVKNYNARHRAPDHHAPRGRTIHHSTSTHGPLTLGVGDAPASG